MKQSTAISVVINTYNAEKHLVQVVESVKHFDEIIVCDMESTDDTITIAKSMGCKVITFPKGNYNIVEPVSYTHLDVYKRQDIQLLSTRIRLGWRIRWRPQSDEITKRMDTLAKAQR